jgi:hypothetical protein
MFVAIPGSILMSFLLLLLLALAFLVAVLLPFLLSAAFFSARAKNPEEIINLVELVVGVAVMCESKAIFIRNIFLLNPDSQAILKDLVEHVLGRATDLEEEDAAEDVVDNEEGGNKAAGSAEVGEDGKKSSFSSAVPRASSSDNNAEEELIR